MIYSDMLIYALVFSNHKEQGLGHVANMAVASTSPISDI